MKTFSIGGVHPHDSKISANAAIESFPIPEVAYISMGQHLGAPAEPIVQKGDKVKVGQLIAKPTGFVSAKGLGANPDNLHFNSKSLREFGVRYYKEFEKLEEES